MTLQNFLSLKTGLYKIYWSNGAEGGISIASLGITREGKRWIAPTNWTSPFIIEDYNDESTVRLLSAIDNMKKLQIIEEPENLLLKRILAIKNNFLKIV